MDDDTTYLPCAACLSLVPSGQVQPTIHGLVCDGCIEDCCEGCGMPDPCGVHYATCPYLEPGDWTVPAGYDGSDRYSDATPYEEPRS